MPTLFEFLDSINTSKTDLMVDGIAEKDYSPYMINRGMSLFVDTLFYANHINQYQDLSKRMHYDFYRHAVPAKKRFSKWHKADKESDDLKLLSETYQCSYEKAKTYLSMLTSDQLEEIRAKRKIGGRM